MKNIISTIFTMLLLTVASFGQNPQALNGYKYIYMPPLVYQNGSVDSWNIYSTARNIFQDKGFGIVVDVSDPSKLFKDIQDNICIVLTCVIEHPAPSLVRNSVTFSFYNCNGQLVYKTSGSGGMGMDITGDFRIAVRKALSEIRSLNYSYNPSLTPQIVYPEVEKTNQTEESLKNYLSSNTLDPIEGIYKSYQSDQLSYYKFAIIKSEDKFKAIIIESDYKHWKTGEVKAIFEQSSMKGFYSVKWYLGDKTTYQTFGNMDNEALLSIEFKDQKSGEKRQDKFIKMFPAASNNISFNKKDNLKSSGSGFFVTTSGIIATNAHVIEGAANIEITISNEIGNFTYKAKTLLVDDKNDVALLQIEDDKFKGLNNIPYGVIENSEVGSKVFTIGYPLNDVMGSNFKVTDGIISSTSGIADDVRYYQISVPIQPGNSGGPLFNKDGNVIGLTTAKLNSKAVGTQVENVNYAIKSSYLLNLYKMLPNTTSIATKSEVGSKELQDQVKILKNYVCLIRIY